MMLRCVVVYLVSPSGQTKTAILTLLQVAHKVYGVPQTINSANYVYFLAYKELFALRERGDSDERLDEIVNGKVQGPFHSRSTLINEY